MPRLSAVKRFVSSTGVRIYRIACNALPNLSGRVYLLLGAGPPTLVDTGLGEPESLRQLLDGLAAVRNDFGESFCLRDLGRVLVTHAHFDHIGGLAEIVARSGAQVGCHPMDRRVIEAWDERAVLYSQGMQAFLQQAGVAAEAEPELIRHFGSIPGRLRSVPVDLLVEDGSELDGLRFIHVPGHCPGHVCILVGNLLLTGDHVLFRTVPQPWPERIAAWMGMGHYLESLDKIRRIEGVELALGGHEPPIQDFYARCNEIRQSHLRRLDRLLEVVRTAPGPITIDEMTQRMYSRQTGFFAMLAISDVGARVEYLDQRGLLAIDNIAEVTRSPDAPYRYTASSSGGRQAPGGPR